MNAKEAKEIIKRVDSNEEAVGRLNNLSQLGSKYWVAKGYLLCLQGEEVKELVELVEKLSAALNDHLGFRYYPNGVGDFTLLITRAEEAISKYHEAIK